MSTVRLSIATANYDRIQALKSGEVAVEGCALDYVTSDPVSTFQRLFRKQEFDIAEMSFSTYMLTVSQGGFPYRAVPIFLSRVFPHCSIYVRTDRGIRTPQDLKGRLIGIPSYHFTRGLVVRGMLQDDYGITPRDIRWRIGGVDRPEDLNYIAKPNPPGIHIESVEPGGWLGAELKDGRIDGIITYRDPQVFVDETPGIGRLFPDFRAAEQDWFRRTGIFPTMHVIGIRESLIERFPALPLNVCRAFEAAKRACRPILFDLDALTYMLPWLVAEAEATVRAMGRDYWPYGVAKNRRMIEAQARWSFEQGLTDRILTPEELFVPGTQLWDP